MDEAFDLSCFRDVAAALNEGSKQPTVDTVHGVLRRLSGSRRFERRADCGPGGGEPPRDRGRSCSLRAATRALNVSATTTADSSGTACLLRVFGAGRAGESRRP